MPSPTFQSGIKVSLLRIPAGPLFNEFILGMLGQRITEKEPPWYKELKGRVMFYDYKC